LLALSASGAAAQQIQVKWNDCALDGGAATKTSTCLSNSGVNRVVVSYTPPAPLADFVAIDGTLDLQFDNGTVPQWWQFKNAGSCRINAAGISIDVNTLPNSFTCVDTWDGGNGAIGLFTGYGPEFGGQPYRARAVFAIARPADAPMALAAGTNYFGWVWTISNANTVAPSVICAGCADPVAVWAPTMVLSGISNGGNSAAAAPIVLTASPDDGQSCVSWNSGSCEGTPTRATTWGNVKAMYR
jgi:hypothetical protein